MLSRHVTRPAPDVNRNQLLHGGGGGRGREAQTATFNAAFTSRPGDLRVSRLGPLIIVGAEEERGAASVGAEVSNSEYEFISDTRAVS